MTPAAFRAASGVSRETLARLEIYAALLTEWRRRASLVSRASLSDLWRRHMLDSAQLLGLAPTGARVWVDLGSGAGFPGMVLAIMGAREVHLIDSNARKCRFLGAVARATRTPVRIHCARIEALDPWPADVVTARALAPLATLLEHARPFFHDHTVGLFPKGQHVETELTAAPKYRTIVSRMVTSQSDAHGTVLIVKGLIAKGMSHLGSES